MKAKKVTEHEALKDLYSPRVVSRIDSFMDKILDELEKRGVSIEKNHVTISAILKELMDTRFEENVMERTKARRKEARDAERDIRHVKLAYTKGDDGRITARRYDADRPRMKAGRPRTDKSKR